MDYDDIDYDEGYSMSDIDNDWFNANMEYETNSDFDSDMDNYNYNNTNNWSTFTGNKINRQTNRHSNSFLDRINKKFESLEAIERTTTVERKNDRDNRIDSFLELYEKIKSLNLKQERNFEPHQRSSLVTDNWYDRKNNSLVSTDRFINSNKKDYSQEVQKMIDVVKVRSSIERQGNNNKKDDIIETIQKKKLDGDKEKGIIRKGIVKEMLERIERQQGNSTLSNSKDGTLRKELDIGKDIVKERNMIKKEKEKDSLAKTNDSPRNDDSLKEMLERQNNDMIRRKLDTKEEERQVNKDEKDDSSKKSNSFKEKLMKD